MKGMKRLKENTHKRAWLKLFIKIDDIINRRYTFAPKHVLNAQIICLIYWIY